MGLLDRLGKEKKPEREETGVEYKTDVDKIYFEVKKAEDVSLLSLSKRLGIKKEKVEEYAEILDKQGLLDLYYSGFGSPRLKMREAKKRIVLKKEKKIKNLLIFALILLIVLIGFIVYIKFLRVR